MKTGRARIDAVSVRCPECAEYFYDEDDHDWTAASRRVTTAYKPGRQVRCRSCNVDFRMPSVMGRIGK
jgi:hypothetical protein